VPTGIAGAGLVRHSFSFPASGKTIRFVTINSWRRVVLCIPAPPGIPSHPAQAIVRTAAASDDSAGKYFHYQYAIMPTGLGQTG